MLRVGIYGASGFTGYELIKILARHPQAELAFATSTTYAGKRYSEVYPCPYEQVLVPPEEASLDGVDLVFLCTPHTASASIAQRVLDAGVRCVDLSADFRLKDLSVYEAWYAKHPAPKLLSEAVYGLTEIYRPEIAQARLVANPGCYPTGPLLALYPLLREGIVADDKIIIDAKSGVSGAGAAPTPTTHFVQVHDNLSVYKVGHTHRHVPEIEQELRRYGHPSLRIVFTPHLLPVSRGILSTIYVNVDPTWDESRIVSLWKEFYPHEPFLQILEAGSTATLAHVVNNNCCALSVSSAGTPGEFILVTALDNLLKGASGQAVQNMNVMYGLDETLGLAT
ncbi:MAG: N-acetyl-gamma-glutamyl-phosphate reductase [Chloroflexi bacterium RBG_13_56_8]|nr:MAG: N-acetyl-gamma-glutamyl-phosphate reductase [Chloroflexi bacterium RBG_13_56_8]